MIVDDHKSIVWGLQRLIESSEPRMEVVAMANSCAEMLSTVAAANPDIILLDLDLNGENAVDVIADLPRGAGILRLCDPRFSAVDADTGERLGLLVKQTARRLRAQLASDLVLDRTEFLL